MDADSTVDTPQTDEEKSQEVTNTEESPAKTDDEKLDSNETKDESMETGSPADEESKPENANEQAPQDEDSKLEKQYSSDSFASASSHTSKKGKNYTSFHQIQIKQL